ncbi:MAG: tail fiber domain-containing protein [Bacteroidales bacterium]|nr:tail fiber domain-containing protein [Bacteroidales bacterium]
MKNTKRKVATLLALAVCTVGHTQITVTSDGNVGVGINNPLSKFSINIEGDTLQTVRIYNPDDYHGSTALYASLAVPSSVLSSNQYRAIFGSANPGKGFTFGVHGQSLNVTPLNNGQAYGVCGAAGNASLNFGVSGVLNGSNDGAAIIGKAKGSGWGEYTGGKFAGYFVGNVYVSDVLTIGIKPDSDPEYSLEVDGDASVVSLYESSDANLKENVVNLPGALDNLKQLRGVTYNFKKPEATSSDLSGSIDTGEVEVNNPLEADSLRYTRKRIGFLAQELQTYYPELVREDGDGMLSINYTGLIPVIVEAIKEQDKIINELKQEVKSLQSAMLSIGVTREEVIASLNSDTLTECAVLFQNAPNPFNTSTEIRYYLPEQVQQAYLYIFNMQGTLLETTVLNNREYGQITINASELNPGMYIYSLVTDGKEVDTKRMILTE